MGIVAHEDHSAQENPRTVDAETTRPTIETMEKWADFDGMMDALEEHCRLEGRQTTIETLDAADIDIEGSLGKPILAHVQLSTDLYFYAGMLTQWAIDRREPPPRKGDLAAALRLMRDRSLAIAEESRQAYIAKFGEAEWDKVNPDRTR